MSDHRLHLLLIGNDEEQLGRGRGDVLMVLTFDPVGKRLTFLNIPRDTRVQLPGRGWVKLNAAYAYGGPSLQTQAVERFLGFPMDRYVEISLAGFRQAIDAVGGVEVHPAFAFTVGPYAFTPGSQRLDGLQALAYTRMRKNDPEGDLGRNRRQQEVIASLIREFSAVPLDDLIGLVDRLLDDLASNLRTNLTPSEVITVRTQHSYLLESQAHEQVRGTGKIIGGSWYYVVPDQERQRLHLLLRDR
ncbi:LCP family protein [Deinococcus terrestris]|nr:LCP family protein [Deinococcus terrestris]